ncbi:MAG TPA: AI-2E family transporter [Anaerolineales bacterium]|nr:AI-2E family transporter [Anaerolineales bacterium]
MKSRFITQRIFFFGMVAILAILALILVWSFVQAILLAIAVVILLKPLYNRLLDKKFINGSEKKATGLTMLIFVLLIAIPAVLIVGGAISQAALLFSGLDLTTMDFSMSGVNNWLGQLINTFSAGVTPLEDIQLSEAIYQVTAWLTDWVRNILVSLGRSLPGIFMNGVVVLVVVYVFLPRYKGPGKQDIMDIVPFPPEITQLFMDKIDTMIKAMFKGTFVIAIVSGLGMGLVLWIAGVPFVMFLTILSIFLSLVPMIGVSLVAWPVGILLILTGNVWQGIFVLVAFLVLIANIDTILRPKLIPKDAQLNPALVILSVLGGLGVMGIIGALYGPVVMILLVTSIDVYSKYLLRSDLEILDQQGRIDLKELGLIHEDQPAGENIGDMVVTALKNVSARLRRETKLDEPISNPDPANQQVL